uniref:C2HC/C3H-type domain-containing protein n=1 Tax=Takifugu rubripes TaxID=31033 RepID=A0A3B5KHM8_TAKRU
SSIIKDGGPKSPPPATPDSNYIQCPYCQRSFNKHAAERHIKFCQEQAACKSRKEKLADENKPPARTQANPAAAPTVPLASSRLPQRSGLGQPTGEGAATSYLRTLVLFRFILLGVVLSHGRLFVL